MIAPSIIEFLDNTLLFPSHGLLQAHQMQIMMFMWIVGHLKSKGNLHTSNSRNTEKTCPKGGMMAARNEAVAYETRNMEGGMDMFEKQFDGVVKVMEVKEIEMIEMRILAMFKKQFNGIVNVRLMGSVVIYMGMMYMKMVEMSKKQFYGVDDMKRRLGN